MPIDAFFFLEELIRLFTSNCDYIYRIRTRRQTCLSLICVYDLFMNLLRIFASQYKYCDAYSPLCLLK
jgi:hypothetical protein